MQGCYHARRRATSEADDMIVIECQTESSSPNAPKFLAAWLSRGKGRS